MKRIAQGWAVWIIGVFGICGLDYWLRSRDANIHSGELPEPIQLFLLILLACAALYIWHSGIREMAIWKKVAVIVPQIIVGYFAFVYIAIAYVCSAGIDCL